MGMNYYWYKNKPCPACGRNDEPLHVGKSSAGWVFSLHIVPEENINDFEDWLKKFDIKGSYIENEDGEKKTREEMIDTITKRKHPDGLLRHDLGGICLKHGKGTWDCLEGKFS